MQEVCNLILLQSKFSAYIRQMLLVLKFIIHSFQKELHHARLSISTRQKTGNSIIYQGQPPKAVSFVLYRSPSSHSPNSSAISAYVIFLILPLLSKTNTATFSCLNSSVFIYFYSSQK